MAIWQYTFNILPKRAFEYNPFPKRDEDGLFDDEEYWNAEHFSCLFFNDIKKILPKGYSGNKELLMFGDFESNVLSLICKNGRIATASFRINYTSNYEEILRELIEFFLLNGLVVLDENLNEVPLNFESFKNIMESSSQVKKYNQLLKTQKRGDFLIVLKENENILKEILDPKKIIAVVPFTMNESERKTFFF